MEKNIEKLMRRDFESKTVYGNDDKYIKTKIRIYAGSLIRNFRNKKYQKKNYHAKITILNLN